MFLNRNFKVENKQSQIEFWVNDKKFIGTGLNKKLAKQDCAKQVIKNHLDNMG